MICNPASGKPPFRSRGAPHSQHLTRPEKGSMEAFWYATYTGKGSDGKYRMHVRVFLGVLVVRRLMTCPPVRSGTLRATMAQSCIWSAYLRFSLDIPRCLYTLSFRGTHTPCFNSAR